MPYNPTSYFKNLRKLPALRTRYNATNAVLILIERMRKSRANGRCEIHETFLSGG